METRRARHRAWKRQEPPRGADSRRCWSWSGCALLVALPGPLAAQDWFRTGTGLGVTKPTRGRGGFRFAQPRLRHALATLFSDVVRNDLDYSGIVDLASKSFYPTQVPSVPGGAELPGLERSRRSRRSFWPSAI